MIGEHRGTPESLEIGFIDNAAKEGRIGHSFVAGNFRQLLHVVEVVHVHAQEPAAARKNQIRLPVQVVTRSASFAAGLSTWVLSRPEKIQQPMMLWSR